MTSALIFLVVVVVFIAWVASMYNKLVSLRNR
ncbi:MAG: LemA family protein, partial [Acidobacteria bacterium]|nr:LemA family protein [Acidobacteriota bacterium]